MNNSKNESPVLAKTTQMLILALVAAAAIIGIVVYYTPLDEEPEVSASNEPSVEEVESEEPAKEKLPLEGITKQQRQELLASELASLELATSPEEIVLASFREELTSLADQMVATKQEDPAVHLFAANIYAELEDLDKAKAIWQAEIDSGKMLLEPFERMSQQLIKEGKEAEAIEVLQLARSRGLTSELLTAQLALALEKTGDIEGAENALAEGLRFEPNNTRLLLSLARILNERTAYERAETTAKRALAMNFKSREALRLLDVALTEQGKEEEALPIRERLSAAEAQDQASEKDESSSVSSEAETLRRFGHDAFVTAAALCDQQGRPVIAENYLRRAISIAPDEVAPYVALCSMARQQGKLLTALVLQQKLLELKPDRVINYSNLASLAWQLGDVELAKETLQAGVQADPNGVLTQSALARIYLVEGQFAQAKQLAAQVIERNRSVESFVLMSAIHEGAGETEAAEAAIEQARRINPGHPLLQSSQTAP